MVRATASARPRSPLWAVAPGQFGKRSRLGARFGDSTGDGFDVGSQPGRVVQMSCPGNGDNKTAERLCLGARIADFTGNGLGVSGQPGRPVQVSGTDACSYQPGKRMRLNAEVGDVGHGLGVSGRPVRPVQFRPPALRRRPDR